MKSYTEQNPTFSENIQITESTDAAHADNVNEAPKQLLQNDLVLKEQMGSYTASGTRLELETAEGGIKLNRINGNTIKKENKLTSVGEFSKVDVEWIENKNYGYDGGINPNSYRNRRCSNKHRCKSGDSIFALYEGNKKFEHSENYSLGILFWGNGRYLSGKDFKSKSNYIHAIAPDGADEFALNSINENNKIKVVIDYSPHTIKLSNANMIDVILYGAVSANGAACAANLKSTYIESGEYTLSAEVSANQHTMACWNRISGVIPSYVNFDVMPGTKRYHIKINISESTYLPVLKPLICKASSDRVAISVENVTLVRGDSYEYIPYEEYTVDLMLNEPLCRINEEYYDYIDVENGVIVYKTKKIGLNGDNNFVFSNGTQFRLVSPAWNVLSAKKNSDIYPGISDRFTSSSADAVWSGSKDMIFSINISGDLVGHSKSITSAETAKAFFRENPTTFILPLKEPKIVPLSAEQIKALTSLKSYEKKTIIASGDGLARLDLQYGKTEAVAKGLLAENTKLYAESLEKIIEEQVDAVRSEVEQKKTEILGKIGKKFVFSPTTPAETDVVWVKTVDGAEVIGAETYAYISGKWKKIVSSEISHIEAVVNDCGIYLSTENQGGGANLWEDSSFKNQYKNNKMIAFNDFCEHIMDGNSIIMRTKKVHSSASHGMQMYLYGNLYITNSDGRRIPFGKIARENNVETRITFSVKSDGAYQYGDISGHPSAANSSIYSTGTSMFDERPNKRVFDFKKNKVDLPKFTLRVGRFVGNWGKFTFSNAIIGNKSYPIIFVNEVK